MHGTRLPRVRPASPGLGRTWNVGGGRHWGRGLGESACSGVNGTALESSCPHEMTWAPPPRNCVGGGREEGGESGKGAGRLPSYCDD